VLRGIHYQLHKLKIDWRLPAGVQPILSARDTAAKRFRDAEHYP
jgi:dTDP-4-dehydrorhamnose 3,5-epimerase-like enzyme